MWILYCFEHVVSKHTFDNLANRVLQLRLIFLQIR